jgi:hypothetical protein
MTTPLCLDAILIDWKRRFLLNLLSFYVFSLVSVKKSAEQLFNFLIFPPKLWTLFLTSHPTIQSVNRLSHRRDSTKKKPNSGQAGKMGRTLTANFFLLKFGNKRTIQKQKTCTLFQPQDHLTQDLHRII